MPLIKVKCQACGIDDELKNNIELDKEADFFMCPSHTDYTGAEVHALFCFSCGSINAAALDSDENLRYILTYKLDETDLEKWCVEKKVPSIAIEKLKNYNYLK
ncbi:MAG: hypothetical protein P8L74_02740 [Gammaproteobacteria bacterium]|jgi:Zn finger protein HypA/HybF involved in hydrogenase expression|nr:hypothetical protein [Gammaproteobacteria bacterium]|tara:strand:- start:171 stop:479 length:309 start_codon:yes stop_codon:yes gene_type:complete